MSACDQLLARGELLVARAWRTLGLPLALQPLAEHEVGLIDPEAALVLALLQARPLPRLASDLPVWLRLYGDLLNRQKLRTMLRGLPPRWASLAARGVASWPAQQSVVRYIASALRVAGGTASGTPDLAAAATRSGKAPRRNHAAPPVRQPGAVAATRAAPGARRPAARSLADRRTAARREAALASRDVVAARCLMVHSRLLFGTGFRADCVSLLATSRPPASASRIARLLGTSASTVSRILADLRACGYLDRDLRARAVCTPRPGAVAQAGYPGLLLSRELIDAWCELLDVRAMGSAALQRPLVEDLTRSADLFWTLAREGGQVGLGEAGRNFII